MNKRGSIGFLSEETVKNIIGIIILVILFGILIALYFSYSNSSKEMEIAEESLEDFVQELNSGATYYSFYQPVGWALVNGPIKQIDNIYFSDVSCPENAESCLCLCKFYDVNHPSTIGVDLGDLCSKKFCKKTKYLVANSDLYSGLVSEEENKPLFIFLYKSPIDVNIRGNQILKTDIIPYATEM